MELEQAHAFDTQEARDRVRALGEYLVNKHGMKVDWLGDDRLRLHGKYTVINIDAEVSIEGKRVRVSGKDPGMLVRAAAKKYVGSKLEHYLDPKQALATLPRT